MTLTAIDTTRADRAIESIGRTYRARTPRSRALHERACVVLPGGSTRAGTFFLPYPTYMERGTGCRLDCVDGHTYVDCLNNYTSLVHGHAHPRLVSVLAECASRSTAHGAPVESEIALAESIAARVGSIEQLRFTNSGTEAVMCALRAARAYTGRSMVLKMEGGYHGSYDAAEVSVDPGTDAPAWPRGRPDGPGLSPGLTGEVVVGPFNDVATITALIDQYRQQLAAVIIEPVMNAAGMIPATPTFLSAVAAAARDADVLLILDEVVTLRLARGGAQALYALTPDLTTFGKIIGGGLPVGAFGGRADIMRTFDSRRADAAFHSGTFNGNLATMAVGRAALDLLTAEEIARINNLGDRLRGGLQRSADRAGAPVQVTGRGSLCHVHLLQTPVHDYRSAVAGSRPMAAALHLALLNHGVVTAPRGMLSVSTAMTADDIDVVIDAFAAAVAEVAPAISGAPRVAGEG
jgi:glutamate-1-semialdehyde 2,1-aminomutase